MSPGSCSEPQGAYTFLSTATLTSWYPGDMLRVSDETRERVLRIGQEEFGGVSADETVRRLIDEHWRSAAITAVHAYREADPEGWARYLAEAEELASADAPITDEWAEGRE